MFKKIYILMAVLIVASMALAACQPTAAPTEPAAPSTPALKVCQITDTGGIDDKSFNATAWAGVERAQAELGAEIKYLESQQQTDYEKNINAFVEDKCDLIVTVGFLLGDATAAGAAANTSQKFAIVDYGYDPVIPNVLALTFATDQAAFLAGYAAAGATKTGKVGTFGGIQIPTVTVFMDGFAMGVKYYNEKHGTNVEVLGWDVDAQTGSFTGNFESTDDGRIYGQTLMDEGADIIMPVAGPVGLGTAAAVQERGNAWIIGVDTDWTVSASQYTPIVFTSVLKKMDVAVFDAAKAVQGGTFAGGFYSGTLANGGVDISPVAAGTISDELRAELAQVKADIIAGTIKTAP